VPPEGHAYIYESYTSPAARGRGAYPFVLLNIVSWAAASGLSKLWVAVEADNAASLRAVEKAGFAPEFQITFARSLGRLEIELPKPTPDRLALEKKFSSYGG
jgi:RimJ/RimL family protein N-acetyltransferase